MRLSFLLAATIAAETTTNADTTDTQTRTIKKMRLHAFNHFNPCPRLQLSCGLCSLNNADAKLDECTIVPYRFDSENQKHICGRVECHGKRKAAVASTTEAIDAKTEAIDAENQLEFYNNFYRYFGL
jgi:hypothetical protein